MIHNDDYINLKLPKALKERFNRALNKRLQTRARVLRRAIEEYCDETDRMGTPKRIK
jgi:metal-responsive CopG/Arc/MetJ family transcriptional regulator